MAIRNPITLSHTALLATSSHSIPAPSPPIEPNPPSQYADLQYFRNMFDEKGGIGERFGGNGEFAIFPTF